MTGIAATVQAFFTERLINQRQSSPATIAAYRDATRMLLQFTAGHTGKPCHLLEFDDLTAPTVSMFLDHLEHDRENCVRTRNARLAAIHSLFAFAALHHPEHAADIQRVLAIPTKRGDRTIITYLTDKEVQALLGAPDRSTRTGRRDHAILYLAIQTGLRASELISMRRSDVHFGTGAYVNCLGKGRKNRITPLTAITCTVLRDWMNEQPTTPDGRLFTTNRGGALSPDALAQRVTLHAATAASNCDSLTGKRVTPHVLRHTAAMRLLHAGVDTTVIALWLGHESVATTGIYLHADLEFKQRALDKTTPTTTAPGRYHPTDPLITFLEAL
ncbi:tyrosine-type recombinase/integrase [Nocardia abscessus]|uniref:tyrosine-type recombinase/integrase n=1 Tax=Nocardia abscessus TaxID=120957 RepID=UPI0024542C89|nr:tyrosine-type recombinase/integrase [Nocardia abscessus]